MRSAILKLTVPATIIRSAWRGVARKAPAPKRSMSWCAAPTAIISIAQQARPKVIGQMLESLAQLISQSTLVVSTFSSKAFSRLGSSLAILVRPSGGLRNGGGLAGRLGGLLGRGRGGLALGLDLAHRAQAHGARLLLGLPALARVGEHPVEVALDPYI